MLFPFSGPSELGRGAVISSAQTIPDFLVGLRQFRIDDSSLASPRELVEQMHRCWVDREPVVVKLEVDAAVLREASRTSEDRPPWQLGPSYLFELHRLHFLVWNNNVDLRSGEPVWWWARKASSLGASLSTGHEFDVLLPDGSPAFCDGGPLRPFGLDRMMVVPYVAIEAGSLRPVRDSSSNSDLASDQSTAVHHRGGPARVIAPAGSGKTRVLTERLRHLLADWQVEPTVVCAVAYNTRAANELTARTSGVPARVRTLNALALAIVNGTGGFARSRLEERQRTMIDERGVRNALQGMVDLPRRVNSDPLAAWVDALSAVRLGLSSPQAVEAESGDVDGFAEVFEVYRRHLSEHHLLDFDEQIYRAIEVLLQDPDARRVAQLQCRILLVDEFQDLTPAHVLLLRILASPALDVFGVGDDDQVIYGYSGADPRYLVDYSDWFPGAALHALEINYRCPPAVVRSARNMLTRNGVRVAKRIEHHPDRLEAPNDLVVEKVDVRQMAQRAADLVQKWTADDGTIDVAVLSRVNVTLLPLQVLLTEAGVPNSSPVGGALLDRTGIRTAFAYLRIALDPDNIRRADLVDTVRRPSRKIARNVVDLITKRQHSSLDDLRSLARALTGNDGPRVEHYVDDLQAVVSAARSGGTASALEAIRSNVGLGEAMDVLDSSRKEADRSTHADDLAALTAVAHLHPDAETFESWLRGVLVTDKSTTGVELSTVHRVKGREWSRVIVYDLSAGVMPHRLSSDIAEERRVLHVALTRGRQQVVALADFDSPSRFLDELDEAGEPEIDLPRSRRQEVSTASSKRQSGRPAELGLVAAVPGGSEGTIIDLTSDGAVLSVGRARVSVSWGTTLRVAGKLVELVPPRDERSERLVVALKEWRRQTAGELKVPAFTVLHDSHVDGIATAFPKSLDELARCQGIGATKLERWGDEILATLEAADARSEDDRSPA